MSRNNKNLKIKKEFLNPITFKVIIDTDDDFIVNDSTMFSKEFTFEKDNSVIENLFSMIRGFKFKAIKNKETKLNDFESMIYSKDFSKEVEKLILNKNHVNYSPRVQVGGNQTLVIEVI